MAIDELCAHGLPIYHIIYSLVIQVIECKTGQELRILKSHLDS